MATIIISLHKVQPVAQPCAQRQDQVFGEIALGDEFFDKFPDMKEILELSLLISTRLLIVAICNSDMATTQRISAMRLVASLAGKQLAPEEDEPGFRPASAPLTIPRGSKEEVSATLDKIRQLSQ